MPYYIYAKKRGGMRWQKIGWAATQRVAYNAIRDEYASQKEEYGPLYDFKMEYTRKGG
jgi:hypothetical protein